MARSTLRESTRQLFDEQRLGGEELQRLQSLLADGDNSAEATEQRTAENPAAARPAPRTARRPSGAQARSNGGVWQQRRGFLAGVACMVGVGAAVLVLGPPGIGRSRPPLDRLASDVWDNHVRLKDLDLYADHPRDLHVMMVRLGFAPTVPEALAWGGLDLRGARYCSLLGVTAIQIVFDADDGSTVTHYQARYRPEAFGELAAGEVHQAQVNDGRVRVWLEDDLLMAEARPRG